MDWKLTRVQYRHYRLLADRGLWIADVRWAPDGPDGGCWVVWYDADGTRWRKYAEHATLKAARAWIGEHLALIASGTPA